MWTLMPDRDAFLTTGEMAYVADVEPRMVSRMIDEGILPDDYVVRNGARQIDADAAPLIAFYDETADTLTATKRRDVIGNIASGAFSAELSGDPFDRAIGGWIDQAIDRTRRRMGELEQARNLIVSDPDIFGGEPVLRDTRIPLCDLVALAGEAPMEEVLEDYPALDARMVELALIYAGTHPVRGRPPVEMPKPRAGTVEYRAPLALADLVSEIASETSAEDPVRAAASNA
jgi:uncharacterized protein (DUF433 family)